MPSDADRLEWARAQQQESRRVRDQDEHRPPPASRCCCRMCGADDHREWAH